MWGSPSMLITRDMHNLVRTSQPAGLVLWERDIDNAFWELDKDTIIEGINTAVRVVRDYRKIRGDYWCSIAKRNPKSQDRIGKVSGKDFRLVPLEDLLSFVRWDMHSNN